MKTLTIAILTMAMCRFCMAQDKTTEKKPAEKSAMGHEHGKAPAAPEMPKPPAEIEKMMAMVGTWSATIKTEPGPWMPKGGTDKGSMVVTNGPVGFSVVQDLNPKGSLGDPAGA